MLLCAARPATALQPARRQRLHQRGQARTRICMYTPLHVHVHGRCVLLSLCSSAKAPSPSLTRCLSRAPAFTLSRPCASPPSRTTQRRELLPGSAGGDGLDQAAGHCRRVPDYGAQAASASTHGGDRGGIGTRLVGLEGFRRTEAQRLVPSQLCFHAWAPSSSQHTASPSTCFSRCVRYSTPSPPLAAHLAYSLPPVTTCPHEP